MRILVLTSEYPPRGDTNLIHSYTKEWAREKVEVDVFFQCERLIPPLCYFSKRIEKRKPSGFFKRYILDNVSVYKVPINRLYPRVERATSSSVFIANLILKKILKKNKYSIIVNHYCTKNIIFINTIKNNSNAKIFSVFHDCDISNEANAKTIIENSDFIGARSRKIFCYLAKMYDPGEIYMIRSGIPDYMFQDITQNVDNFNKICYIGKLIERKKVDTILEMMNLLKNKYELSLNIIGDGTESNKLKNMVAKYGLPNVVFIGYLERNGAFEYLKNSNIFIMVSRNETFGLVYLEAMAAGNIVIGSRNEGIDGIIIDGQNGYLVDPGDPIMLAEVVQKIIQLPIDEKIEIINNAIKTAKNYKESQIAADYLKQLREIVDEK